MPLLPGVSQSNYVIGNQADHVVSDKIECCIPIRVSIVLS